MPMKKDTSVWCKKCDDLKEHKLITEGKVSEEWQCKECGATRIFGK
jgi:uncharacterized Zn finger protein